MPAPARQHRSNAAPAGRQTTADRKRPQLHVVAQRSTTSQSSSRGLGRILEWARMRSTPVVHIIVAVVFLVACLLGALFLRTQMGTNSFEATRIEEHITMLQQDVEDDQAKLAQLEATLPERAQKMNMGPSQGSLSINLQGYTPSEGSKQ